MGAGFGSLALLDLLGSEGLLEPETDSEQAKKHFNPRGQVRDLAVYGGGTELGRYLLIPRLS